MTPLPRHYFLSPTAINSLRDHKKWSLSRFGHTVTKKYFQDFDKGLQFIADHHARFPAKTALERDSGLSLYLIREHYVVYVPRQDGVYIVAILGKAQDIPNILHEYAVLFHQEWQRATPPSSQRGNKGRKKGR